MFKHSLSVVPLLFALSLAEFESHPPPFRRDSWSLSGSNPASDSEDTYMDDVSIPSYPVWPSALSGVSKTQQNPQDNLMLYGYFKNYISPELATVSFLGAQ